MLTTPALIVTHILAIKGYRLKEKVVGSHLRLVPGVAQPWPSHVRELYNVRVSLEKRLRTLGLSDPLLVVISSLWRRVMTPTWQRPTGPEEWVARLEPHKHTVLPWLWPDPRALESKNGGRIRQRQEAAEPIAVRRLRTLPPPACSHLPAQVTCLLQDGCALFVE